jgi:hypothetical protein
MLSRDFVAVQQYCASIAVLQAASGDTGHICMIIDCSADSW